MSDATIILLLAIITPSDRAMTGSVHQLGMVETLPAIPLRYLI